MRNGVARALWSMAASILRCVAARVLRCVAAHVLRCVAAHVLGSGAALVLQWVAALVLHWVAAHVLRSMAACALHCVAAGGLWRSQGVAVMVGSWCPAWLCWEHRCLGGVAHAMLQLASNFQRLKKYSSVCYVTLKCHATAVFFGFVLLSAQLP